MPPASFLTVLAPSERYYQQRGRRHKSLTDCARQAVVQVCRWLPDRQVVLVAGSSYAVIELLAHLSGLAQPVTMLTRLRLDAALYDPHRNASRAPKAAPANKAHGSRRWRSALLTPPRSGKR